MLRLYQSERERECARYAVFKAPGLSATQAIKQFGFESMTQWTKKVEDIMTHVEYIRTASSDKREGSLVESWLELQ